jgi:hypothetical protein
MIHRRHLEAKRRTWSAEALERPSVAYLLVLDDEKGPEFLLRSSPCAALTRYFRVSVYARPVVKYHALFWFPVVVAFWSSRLPASSVTPVVTITLYLVYFASRVSVGPKGSKIALNPSGLLVKVRLVIRVRQSVEVVEEHLYSLKVEVVTESGFTLSEKKAWALALRATPFPVGAQALTLGAVLSILSVKVLAGDSWLPALSVAK